MRCCFSHK